VLNVDTGATQPAEAGQPYLAAVEMRQMRNPSAE
jgi:hypothetical protein